MCGHVFYTAFVSTAQGCLSHWRDLRARPALPMMVSILNGDWVLHTAVGAFLPNNHHEEKTLWLIRPLAPLQAA
jgi:hypothetical protein